MATLPQLTTLGVEVAAAYLYVLYCLIHTGLVPKIWASTRVKKDLFRPLVVDPHNREGWATLVECLDADNQRLLSALVERNTKCRPADLMRDLRATRICSRSRSDSRKLVSLLVALIG